MLFHEYFDTDAFPIFLFRSNLKILTERKPMKTKSKKRIPSLGVRPGLEIGAVVTIRKRFEEVLKKMLVAIDNQLKRKQMSVNNFSFGIKEYIEIPGMEYDRDIGIRGLDITVVRVAYVLVSLFSAGFPGLIVYLILMFVMPDYYEVM